MSTTPACSTDGTVAAIVSGGSPPFRYVWRGPNGFLPDTTSSINASGGKYVVIVTDATLRYESASVSVPLPFQLATSFTNDQCGAGIGTATTAVISGGTPPFSYLWSNGGTTATIAGLTAGNYHVTVTDANGCFVTSAMDSLYVAYVLNTSPITLSVTGTGSQCDDGTATVTNVAGGTAPYTYYWNTTPPQYTAIATHLTPGNKEVIVTDAAGCIGYGGVYISPLPNGITVTVSHTDETCMQANGTAIATATGGQAPYTFLWSTGATSQSISGLSMGSYTVTVTDNLGCPKAASVAIGRSDPLTLALNATVAACNQSNGSIAVTVSGGTAPYTYLWSNAATSQTINGLAIGNYGVSVTDANGCYDHDYAYVDNDPACYATISGSVILDQNMNCQNDQIDYGLVAKVVTIGNTYAVTNYNGDYSKSVLPGSYTVSKAYYPDYFVQQCPYNFGGYTVAAIAGGNYGALDFFDTVAVAANDLEVTITANAARATSSHTVFVSVFNRGSQPILPTISLVHDAMMTFNGSGFAINNYNPSTRTFTFNSGIVYPGQFLNYHVGFDIPTNTPIGTPFSHTAQVLPIVADSVPSNNIRTLHGQVIGSFDPNRKSVFPSGDIYADQEFLNYMIEFQNTGNDTAFTVAIKDTLDLDLDPASIQVMNATHNYVMDFEAGGVLTFTFNNILLPDSTIDEPRSHGHIAFRIRPKANLSTGTSIDNSAAIYFDYNAPIVTNTTQNVVIGATDVPDIAPTLDFRLFPNPTTNRVTLQWIGKLSRTSEICIYDLNGRKRQAWTIPNGMDPEVELDLAGFPSGIYVLEVNHAGLRATRKLILQ